MNTIKNILALCLLILCCSSCVKTEVDDTFADSPEKRIADSETYYKSLLTKAPHGWKTYFGTTNTLGRWLILMKFDEKGQVTFKCDKVDYYNKLSNNQYEEPNTYRVDFSQSPELIIESFSQFSAWNEFPIDSDGDGYLDRYAGPETQFIIDRYQDGKLYLTGKSNLGVGKGKEDILTFVFEQATEADWTIDNIAAVKKVIGYDSNKGKYQRFLYKETLQESLVIVDESNRMLMYKYFDGNKDQVVGLPFFITTTGFELVKPLKIAGVGSVKKFNVETTTGTVTSDNIPGLSIVHSNAIPSVQRTPFSVFNKLYLGIEVYHATGDPIGRNLKAVFDALRPPYAPNEQHLNVIYFAKNIDKDMGGKPFKYAQELTIIYADTDPKYSDKDLYGANPTFVRIPVEFETSPTRTWVISLVGSIEEAFIAAYPDKVEYAKAKAQEAMPMIYRLMHEKGWGLYPQAMETNNPTVLVKDEEDPDGSFFTLYPYTQEDVNR